MRNGYESIRLQTVTAALPGSGQISSPCATDCHRLCACARDPTTVTEMLERVQCRETGNRLRRYFGVYSSSFLTGVEKVLPSNPAWLVRAVFSPCQAMRWNNSSIT